MEGITEYIQITDGNIDFYSSLVLKKMAKMGRTKLIITVKKGDHEEEAELIVHRVDKTGIKLVDQKEKRIRSKKGEWIKIIEYKFEKIPAIIEP